MKRYLAFAGSNYYPLGGWSDFVGDYDTIPSALIGLLKWKDNMSWWQVVDTETKQIVETFE